MSKRNVKVNFVTGTWPTGLPRYREPMCGWPTDVMFCANCAVPIDACECGWFIDGVEQEHAL